VVQSVLDGGLERYLLQSSEPKLGV
jgi:hypothetical protein